MLQDLVVIPHRVGGLSVFGFGWLLLAWAVVCGGVLAWHAWRRDLGSQLWSLLPTMLVSGAVIAWILPRLQGEAGLPIRGYGVLLVLAIVAGVGLSIHRARQAGVDPELIVSLAFWMVGFGFVGGRLFYVVEYWDEKFHKPTLGATLRAVIDVTSGGLVVYGAYLAGALAVVLFVRKHRISALAMCDLVTPGAMLGLAIGRMGCFLTGCCYGGQCALPWAVSFPGPSLSARDGSPPYADQVRSGALWGLEFVQRRGPDDDPPVLAVVRAGSPAERAGLRAGQRLVAIVWSAPLGQAHPPRLAHQEIELRTVRQAGEVLFNQFHHRQPVRLRVAGEATARVLPVELPPRSLPVHPAQLYSALDALVLTLFLLAYAPFTTRDGQLLAMLLTVHPVSRFLLEVVRVDEAAVFQTGLSISQNLSIGLWALGLGLWIYTRGRPAGKAFYPSPMPRGS